MAYRISGDRTVEANVHRIISEQLEKAIQQLSESFEQQPEDAIHDARKRLKKSRSLLRLVRKSMPKETYKYEKNILRDLGRSLAPARDGEAYRETLSTLLDIYELTLDVKSYADLQQSLADWHELRLQELTDRDEPLHTYLGTLKDSKQRLNQLALEKSGWDAIAKNLHRIYRQGRKRFAKACETDTDEAFHEWRKRVKDLLYDTRLLRDVWPPVMDAFEAETHKLSKLLGDDHDIVELRTFLMGHTEELAIDEVHTKVLLPLMDHRQYKLRQQAKILGTKVYAEDPDAFFERLSQYWQAWFKHSAA